MAENKKSFVLYADLISVVSKLPREVKGDLFQLILDYVNDKNPIVEDNILLEIAFEPIKLQLKRDLKDWNIIKKDRSKSGILGNLKRWNLDLYEKVVSETMAIEEAESIAKHRKAIKEVANIAVTVTDTVNDTVNVNNNNDLVLCDKSPSIKKDYSKYPPDIVTKFFKFDNWVKDKLPNVAKIKTQISIDDFIKLLLISPSDEILASKLEALNNDSKYYKGKQSVFTTIKIWLTKDKDKTPTPKKGYTY